MLEILYFIFMSVAAPCSHIPAVTPCIYVFPAYPNISHHANVTRLGILFREGQLTIGTDGTSKGHPTARTKVRPAGFEAFGVLSGEITSDRI